jgi:ubiquitin-protein ligase
MHEMKQLLRHPHPAIDVYPSETEDLSFWQLVVRGPEGTPSVFKKPKRRKKRRKKREGKREKKEYSIFSIWSVLLTFRCFLFLSPSYSQGTFLVYMRFPKDFPDTAPEMRFVTPILHCNINSHGRICHSVFDRNWTSATSIRTVLECVLVAHPET